MKKTAIWVLVIALLCGLLAACGSQPSAPSNEEASTQSTQTESGKITTPQTTQAELGEIIHKLVDDWYTYTTRCEYLYGDMLWAISYLETFFVDHSWDSLQTARAALSLAERRAELLDLPETAQMTTDDYNMLIQTGADVSAVQFDIDSLPSIKSDILLDYRNYRTYLNSPIEEFFLTYELSHFERWANLMRQYRELDLQFCAVETDYVLLQIDNTEEKTRLIEAITENCPQINARRIGGPQDAAALEDLGNLILDEMEGVNNDLSAVVGQSQANLDLYRDVLEFGLPEDYIDTMVADAVDLQDFPTPLPYPDWWYEQENEEFLFTWGSKTGEDKERKSMLPGDAIETPPDRYFVEWTDVSLGEYQAYLESLEQNGIPAEFITEKDGEHTAFFQVQTGSFALVWEEEETVSFFTMEGSVCFAPPWYVLYTLFLAS